MVYGLFVYEIFGKDSETINRNPIPVSWSFKLAAISSAIQLTIYYPIILTSFTTVNLFNSCNLLSVVLFAVFFSKVSRQLRVSKSHIFVAVIICVGIVIFNLFEHKKSDGINKPLTAWPLILILSNLIM